MAGDENDRNMNVRLREFSLKVEPADARQSDIEHKAGRYIGRLVVEKFGGRTKHLDLEAHRAQQAANRNAHRGVIVDHENDRSRLRLLLHDAPPGLLAATPA